MTKRTPFRLPSAKLFAMAAIAGVIAGAAAVYVKETGSGNGVETAAADQCNAATDKAVSLAPLQKGHVAAMTAAAPSRKIEGLTFKGPAGEDLTLASFTGKTVLLNLWATWCVPCREEMPALDKLQKTHGGERFEVAAINIDTGNDDKPKAFLSETGIQSLAHYRDSSMGVFNVLKKEGLAFGLPVTLLIDEKGCLLGSMNGPAAWDSEDADALVTAAAGL